MFHGQTQQFGECRACYQGHDIWESEKWQNNSVILQSVAKHITDGLDNVILSCIHTHTHTHKHTHTHTPTHTHQHTNTHTHI